jgi:PHD-finger
MKASAQCHNRAAVMLVIHSLEQVRPATLHIHAPAQGFLTQRCAIWLLMLLADVVLQDNDIILCDGPCNRAYHEQCLDPPLKAADLPADESWLCTACSAKVT